MALTSLAFVLAYATGLAAAFTVHPRWGLYTYVAVFYLHPPARWWGTSLPESVRWSLLAAVVTLLALPRAKLPSSATPWSDLTLTKVVIAYVVWMWIQMAWANPGHFEGAVLMSKYVLLFYLIYRLVMDKQSLTDFGLVHVLGCFYFGLLALDAAGTGRLEHIGGPGTSDSNTLGMHVTTGIFFGGALVLAQRGWRRWVVLGTAPFLANCLLQTESRGAFLGALCGALTFYYFAPKRERKFILSLGAIAVCVLLAYAPATYWERMNTLSAVTDEEKELDSSAQSRIEIIKAQFEMFKDHPFGLGFRSTAYLSRDYLDARWLAVRRGLDRATHGSRSSHNTVMSVLTDQGLPGIIIATVGFFAVLSLMRQLRAVELGGADPTLSLMRAAVCASLVTILVSGMFTNYLKAEVLIWVLALLAATLQIARGEAHARATPAPDPASASGSGAPVPY